MSTDETRHHLDRGPRRASPVRAMGGMALSLLLSVLAVACGHQQEATSPPPAEAPAEEVAPSEGGAPTEDKASERLQDGAPAQQPMAPPPGTPGSESPTFAEPPRAERDGATPLLGDAWRDFEVAAHALSQANDCVTACKALASMQRAKERICAIEVPADDGPRCHEASRRLDTSRTRVERSCGNCAG